MLVRGPVAVRFPPSCPNCGSPANRPVRIERSFEIYFAYDDDTPNRTERHVDEFSPLFCESCAHNRKSQMLPLSPLIPIRRILSEAEGFAGVVVIAVGCMLIPSILDGRSLFPLGLACLPWATGFSLVRPVWKRSRHMTVPKPTEIDLSFDFTPPLSLPHEPPWRAFQLRLPSYAAQFEQANADQLWDPQGDEAQSARAQRRAERSKSNIIVGVIVVALLLWALWDQVLSPFVGQFFGSR